MSKIKVDERPLFIMRFRLWYLLFWLGVFVFPCLIFALSILFFPEAFGEVEDKDKFLRGAAAVFFCLAPLIVVAGLFFGTLRVVTTHGLRTVLYTRVRLGRAGVRWRDVSGMEVHKDQLVLFSDGLLLARVNFGVYRDGPRLYRYLRDELGKKDLTTEK